MNSNWTPDPGRFGGPKYLAIAASVTSAIEAGTLRAGDRLPPQRELAVRLGVDLTTVTKAYDQLKERGLIKARGRAGSFILPPAAAAAGPPPRDTGMNMPPETANGSLLASWERGMSALLRAPGAGGRLHYAPAGGRESDRAAGAQIFARLGLASDTDEVVVTAGSQNALHAIVAGTLQPGDTVACGTHVYPGFLALARKAGLRLAPLPRVEPEALAALCRRENIAALYMVPTIDNPTTATLGIDERAAIAQIARHRGIRLIEDDAYGQLPARPLAPLSSFAPELGWYIATLSKIISPALRVAHVRAPSLRDALTLAADIHDNNVMAPPLNAALATHWLEDGSYDRLVGETRAEAGRRQAIAADILPQGSYVGDPCGYHLWVPLAAGSDEARIAAALGDAGMTAIAASAFAVGETDARALRVSLGGAIDDAGLRRGLTLLAMLLPGSRST